MPSCGALTVSALYSCYKPNHEHKNNPIDRYWHCGQVPVGDAAEMYRLRSPGRMLGRYLYLRSEHEWPAARLANHFDRCDTLDLIFFYSTVPCVNSTLAPSLVEI
jgi:hypothetical protein